MSKSVTPAPPDYEVGRGKPPRSTRFKPGQSGNPGGRKKGTKNVRTMVAQVLESEIEYVENGRKRKVSLVEALLKRQAQEGLRGNNRAINDLLDRYERHCSTDTDERIELADEDHELLERALAPRLVPGTDSANPEDSRAGEGEDV